MLIYRLLNVNLWQLKCGIYFHLKAAIKLLIGSHHRESLIERTTVIRGCEPSWRNKWTPVEYVLWCMILKYLSSHQPWIKACLSIVPVESSRGRDLRKRQRWKTRITHLINTSHWNTIISRYMGVDLPHSSPYVWTGNKPVRGGC